MSSLESRLAQIKALADIRERDFCDMQSLCDYHIPALVAALEIAVGALTYYRDTKSSEWDHSTAPPRLRPTFDYGPFRAGEALTQIGAALGIEEGKNE